MLLIAYVALAGLISLSLSFLICKMGHKQYLQQWITMSVQ